MASVNNLLRVSKIYPELRKIIENKFRSKAFVYLAVNGQTPGDKLLEVALGRDKSRYTVYLQRYLNDITLFKRITQHIYSIDFKKMGKIIFDYWKLEFEPSKSPSDVRIDQKTIDVMFDFERKVRSDIDPSYPLEKITKDGMARILMSTKKIYSKKSHKELGDDFFIENIYSNEIIRTTLLAVDKNGFKTVGNNPIPIISYLINFVEAPIKFCLYVHVKERKTNKNQKIYKMDLPKIEIDEFESLIKKLKKINELDHFKEIGGLLSAKIFPNKSKYWLPFRKDYEEQYFVSFQEMLNDILN